MELNIVKEVDMPLLSRKRISLELTSDKETPSRKSLLTKIADKTNTKPELVIVKHIYTKYGSRKSKIIAHVYTNKSDMEQIEEKYLVKKNSLEEPKTEEQ